MDSVDILSNDLRRLHFHTVGAGLLAEKLYELGYRKPGRPLSKEEAKAAMGGMVVPEEIADYWWELTSKLLQAQLDQRGE